MTGELTRELVKDRLLETRRRLLESVAGLSDEQTRTLELAPGWSIHDTLCHILGWNDLLVRALEDWSGPRTWVPQSARSDHDAFNRRSVQERTGVWLPELLDRYVTAVERQALVLDESSSDALYVKGEAPWGGTGTILQAIFGLCGHDAHHVSEIARARTRL